MKPGRLIDELVFSAAMAGGVLAISSSAWESQNKSKQEQIYEKIGGMVYSEQNGDIYRYDPLFDRDHIGPHFNEIHEGVRTKISNVTPLVGILTGIDVAKVSSYICKIEKSERAVDPFVLKSAHESKCESEYRSEIAANEKWELKPAKEREKIAEMRKNGEYPFEGVEGDWDYVYPPKITEKARARVEKKYEYCLLEPYSVNETVTDSKRVCTDWVDEGMKVGTIDESTYTLKNPHVASTIGEKIVVALDDRTGYYGGLALMAAGLGLVASRKLKRAGDARAEKDAAKLGGEALKKLMASGAVKRLIRLAGSLFEVKSKSQTADESTTESIGGYRISLDAIRINNLKDLLLEMRKRDLAKFSNWVAAIYYKANGYKSYMDNVEAHFDEIISGLSNKELSRVLDLLKAEGVELEAEDSHDVADNELTVPKMRLKRLK